DLAAHAHRDVDVEHRRIELRLADMVRLLVLALLDVDALRRAFLLADLARHAAQAGLRIVPVVHEKGKLPETLLQLHPFLGILNGHEPFPPEVRADEVAARLRHSLDESGSKHADSFGS